MTVFIFGAGGHGKVVGDILLAANVAVVGFVDDDASHQGRRPLGLPVFDVAHAEREARSGGVQIALGVGDNDARARVAARCLAFGAELITAIHPRAVVARSATLGAGTVVMAGALVNPDARVGAGAILNTGCIVEHDTIVGDYAHVSPGAALGGTTQLGAFAMLGTGALVLPGICVGDRTVVGGGAVVSRDLPRSVVAYGIPAKVMRQLGGG